MADLPKKIAIIYDRVNKWGGAERVLLALHEIFPQAPLFTAVYNHESARWAKIFPQVIPSFLQKFPYAKSHHELYPWLTPLAFESFNFNQYDAVISVTSTDAKGIVTQPKTFHLCYCLTPTRYLWSHEQFYKSQLDPGTRFITYPLFNYLKFWDRIASTRPDIYVSISQTVSGRVKKYYGRDSQVVYPPVDIDVYSQPSPPPSIKDFFLYVGRLVGYKQPEIIINVFNRLEYPLVIVGSGSEEKKLKRLAKPHIYFAGHVSQSQLVSFYQHTKAVIFFHEEDFGLVPVEAQAAGKPVIALNLGGETETVIHGKTGILIDDNSEESLYSHIYNFDHRLFDPGIIRSNAARFSKQRFQREFVKVFTSGWSKYKEKL